MALTGWGGLAEYVCVPAAKVSPIPDTLPFDDAASLLVTYGMALHALRHRGALQAGETLLVLGAAGGVGLAAIELGKAFGAKVVAAASSPEKLAMAERTGADAGILYLSNGMTPERQRQLTADIKAACGPGGASVVFDPVGGDYSEPAFRAVG